MAIVSYDLIFTAQQNERTIISRPRAPAALMYLSFLPGHHLFCDSVLQRCNCPLTLFSLDGIV